MAIAGAGNFLPYGRQVIEEDDVAAVAAVLRGEALTTGPMVERFEEELCERTGAAFAVVCSNGTTALHLAMLGAGIGLGDRVVVPAVTFLATANAVRYVGAEVVFADVDPDTGLMRPQDLEQALARADGPVRAAAPVHLNGQTADMASLKTLADRHGLRLIEDACHALGTSGPGWKIGDCGHSDFACFSFHPVKTIAMGEGGAVTIHDPNDARRLRRLRSHGMVRESADFMHHADAFDADGSPNPWYYEMPEIGFNYRATDIQCALGLSQLAKLERFVARRRALVDRYAAALAPLAPLVRPIGKVPGCAPAWHLAVALIDFSSAGVTRSVVMRQLREQGIGTQVHYLPVNRQPYYQARYGNIRLPGASTYYDRALSLPLFPSMADSDVDRVVAALADSLGIG
ncbi:UDP-4-amino-4,6-dideoxy-N-acetyl-beta-L-altrosamine transaminase [Azospirillum soli]|uniref:UDP-4-amino-4, 6-dideoxy-N-acetyl-beta-L-altrosamine transaminase n=1 Tax=Azospirillum soli TaxID=1304799 RepID=UPI001AE76448|nr:UDP-4-amino-4,6-dideoxy-N-acetyl-beta-L-altrosamine transaminase [Azospirillum soli]MBP2316066.1 UDP-4-amino-4,6-dideoxy-N-acetyl-beta-L-altrosamine transaminase [Azospirillum soli]